MSLKFGQGNKHGHKQSGVALVMVLVILALVTLIATQLVTMRSIYGYRTQNIIMAENAWGYAVGAEALAKIALVQALKNEETVHLGQPWAGNEVVFPIDGGQLKASLQDSKGCFNINMLAETGNNDDASNAQKPSPAEEAFIRLINLIEWELSDSIMPSAMAASLRDWIDADSVPTRFDGREDDEYTGYAQPYRTANQPVIGVSELRAVSGFPPTVIEELLPYICAIPGYSEQTINVNTIPVEKPQLLASFYENMTLATATEILSARPGDGYTQDDYSPQVPADIELIKGMSISFTSKHFVAMIEVELGNSRTRIKSHLFYEGGVSRVQLLARMGHND